jgi:hypothetical protein
VAQRNFLFEHDCNAYRNNLFPTPAALASPTWQIDQVDGHKFGAVGASVQAF